MHDKGLTAHQKVTEKAEKTFVDLQAALLSTPTLGCPDTKKPFTQTADEKNGYMTSALLQEHGGKMRPVAYFSSKLDPVAAGLPICL